MPLPSLTQARAGSNAVLTNLALGYKPQQFIGLKIAPPVEVAEYGGQVIEFDAACFEAVDDTRADGSAYKEISRGYFGKSFSIESHGLSFRVPEKQYEQSAAKGLNYAMTAAIDLAERSALAVETQIAELVLNPNNYAPTNKEIIGPGSYWGGDGTNSIDPYETILEKKRQIASEIGSDPNTLILGREVFDKLITNAAVTEHYKHTSSTSLTEDILARRFGVDQILVGKAISKPTKMSPTGVIWGNYAQLCYVNRNSINGELGLAASPNMNREQPSFAYTYIMRGEPQISNRWYEEKTGNFYWKIDYDRQPVITMPQGGFLFINPVL
jgi:hypothetical protein